MRDRIHHSIHVAAAVSSRGDRSGKNSTNNNGEHVRQMKIRSSSGAAGAHIGIFGRSLMFAQVAGGEGGGGGTGGGGTGGGAGGQSGGEGGEGGTGGQGGGGGGDDIATMINRTMAARERANEGKQTKKIQEIIQATMPDLVSNAIKQALEAAGLNKPTTQQPQGGDPGNQQNQGMSAAQSAEIEAKLNTFRKESAAAREIAETERNLRMAAETRMKRQEERAKLTEILSGGKDGAPLVRAEMLEDVVQLMLNRVVRDPEQPELILWKGDKWNDREGYDNSLNYMQLTDGISAWANTAKGKAYAPPQNATGGGTRRPHGGLGRGRNPDDPASDAEVGALIVGRRPS